MSLASYLLAFVTGLCVLVCFVAARSPRAPGKQAFILAVLSAIWWTGCVVLRFGTPDLDQKVLYSELAWFGIVGAPLFWAVGTLTYAGYRRFADPRFSVGIALLSVLAGAAALTNDRHHAIYTAILDPSRPTFEHGWLFHILVAVTYVVLIWACIAAATRLHLSQSLHRRQLAGLVISMLLPWLANFAFVFFQFRILNDDPTPFAFAMTSFGMLMMQEHGKLFIAPPIARDVIFNVLPDPVVLIDGEGRVLELNPAANDLPGLGAKVLGTSLPAGHPFRAWIDPSEPLSTNDHQLLSIPDDPRTFEVSVQRLERWGRDGCLMLVLRDVTPREAVETRLAAASRDLSARLEENMALQRKLAEEASRDHLTGLHNRRHASRTVPEILARQGQNGATAFILVDLDHFKHVNDRFGHDAGDEVLVGFADILKQDLRGGEWAFRFGGEEFLIVLPDADMDEAMRRTARWRAELADQTFLGDAVRNLTFSAGISLAPDHGSTLGVCTKVADIALYQAKILGRNRDVVWTTEIKTLEASGRLDRRQTEPEAVRNHPSAA